MSALSATPGIADARYTANPSVAENWTLEQVTRPEPAVRRERPAHRSGRPDLRRPGHRQPDQRARPGNRAAGNRQRQGRRHHRPRRRGLRPERQPLRDRGDGRPGQRARSRRHHPRAARRHALRQRHHLPSGPAVRRRMPRGRSAHGVRPGRRRPRILLEDVPSPNAMEVGPDGLLYFPVMGANEIWRIDPDQAAGRASGGGRRARGTGLGQVRRRRPHRLDAGGQRSGAAHRPAQRRRRRCWPSSPPAWTTAPSSTAACSSRTSPARSPRSCRVAAPSPCCRAGSTGRWT